MLQHPITRGVVSTPPLSARALQREIDRCETEVAAAEHALLSGHLDIAGLCLALSDWSCELRILQNQESQKAAVAHSVASGGLG